MPPRCCLCTMTKDKIHNSPFSEKIRLILGYKALYWRSVLIADLDRALTGMDPPA
jgi:hypothetical protein